MGRPFHAAPVEFGAMSRSVCTGTVAPLGVIIVPLAHVLFANHSMCVWRAGRRSQRDAAREETGAEEARSRFCEEGAPAGGQRRAWS